MAPVGLSWALGNPLPYEDEIRSVEGPVLLAQRPASQEDGKGEGGEDHHDRRDDQCQQEGNLVRLMNPRALVTVGVLVSVHVPASLPDRHECTWRIH